MKEWKLNTHTKILIGATATLLLVIILFSHFGIHQENRNCFQHTASEVENGIILENIDESKKKPAFGKSIFFHETSCFQTRDIHLSTRQACAVESAALLNPNLDVFVLFASSTVLRNSKLTATLDAVLSYPNVYFRSVDPTSYSVDTPIHEWILDGKIFQSNFFQSHVSDFLRYLTLYKWGGTYLDLDVVVVKPLETVKTNFAGAESDTHVAAGVINFDNESFGKEVAAACLRDFQMNFNGADWGNNGPGVITRVLQDICSTKVPQLMSRVRCLGFEVCPIEAFYAIPWRHWYHFFEPEWFDSTMQRINSSIVVHMWNRHSKGKLVKKDSRVVYAKLAEKYCPRVFQSSGSYF